MAKSRRPEPFFVEKRATWYVQLHGKQINLGKDKAAAFEKYHELMLAGTPVDAGAPVEVVIDRFLDWVHKNRSKASYTLYRDFCQSFVTYLLARYKKGIKAIDVKPFHVTEWLDSRANEKMKKKAKAGESEPQMVAKKPFSENSKNTMIRTIKRCFSWAKTIGHIDTDPLKSMELPAKTPREVTVTKEQWELVMLHAKGEEFRDLLVMLLETGCRPFEIFTVTKAMFNADVAQFVFPRKDSKGKKYNRVVYLSETALAIAKKWAAKRTNGERLFLNGDGTAWNRNNLNCRLRRLTKHTGFKLMPYAIRHRFATTGLLNGVDSMVIAELMGHKDLTMVAKTYGHISGKDEFLGENLAKLHGTSKPIPPTTAN